MKKVKFEKGLYNILWLPVVANNGVDILGLDKSYMHMGEVREVLPPSWVTKLGNLSPN